MFAASSDHRMACLGVVAVLAILCGSAVATQVITGNVIWYTEDSPVVLTDQIQIAAGAVLTIEEGVEVRCDDTTTIAPVSIEVLDGGFLSMQGLAGQPITFTSARMPKAAGDWESVTVRSGGGARLTFCSFGYGGWASAPALVLESSEVEIRNVTVATCAGAGIEITNEGSLATLESVTVTGCEGPAFEQSTPQMSPSYTGLAASGNLWDGVLVRTGSIAGIVNWAPAGIPYIIEGWLDVAAGGVLNVAEGTDIRFKDTITLLQSSIRVQEGGVINVLGSESTPVSFSSALPTPEPGDWGYLRIYGGAVAQLAYCEFEYGGSAGYPTVWLQSSDATMANCTIRNGLSHGVLLDGEGLTPSIEGLTVQDCAGAALRMATPEMNPVFAGPFAFSGNAEGDVIYISVDESPITSDHEWADFDVPYAVGGWLIVQDGATLTIGPGVEIQFAPMAIGLQSCLRVNDTSRLEVMGTLDAPVLFTTLSATPAAGAWGYVQYSANAGGVLQHCVIEYAGNLGSTALILESSDVAVTDTEIRHVLSDAIRVSGTGNTSVFERVYVHDCGGRALVESTPDMTPDYTELILCNNALDGIALDADKAPLARDRTFSFCGAPYVVYGNLRASAGVTLEFEPGAIIMFGTRGAARDSALTIEDGAQINARGSAAQPILFTSAEDTPAPGDWARVAFEQGASGYLEHCSFAYGGSNVSGMVRAQTSNVVFEQCLFHWSEGDGLRTADEAAPLLVQNQIEENGAYGVFNESASAVIDAIGTWWGDASGPLHPVLNPDGLGNAVSNAVLFDPWAGSANIGTALVFWPDSLRVPREGGNLRFQVMSLGAGTPQWTAAISGNPAWAQITASDAQGSGQIEVAVQPNAEDYQRVARLTVSGAGISTSTAIIAQTGVLGVGPTHTADVDQDRVMDLLELLRVIQFYNSGHFHCETGTEDGYAPGAGDESCTAHAADYGPQDWAITIVELMRIIQFYNSGGYHNDSSSVDGFGAGQI